MFLVGEVRFLDIQGEISLLGIGNFKTSERTWLQGGVENSERSSTQGRYALFLALKLLNFSRILAEKFLSFLEILLNFSNF